MEIHTIITLDLLNRSQKYQWIISILFYFTGVLAQNVQWWQLKKSVYAAKKAITWKKNCINQHPGFQTVCLNEYSLGEEYYTYRLKALTGESSKNTLNSTLENILR